MSLELKITITSVRSRTNTTKRSRVRLLHKRRVKIMKTTSFVANGINYKFVIGNNQWQKWERIVDGKKEYAIVCFLNPSFKSIVSADYA